MARHHLLYCCPTIDALVLTVKLPLEAGVSVLVHSKSEFSSRYLDLPMSC